MGSLSYFCLKAYDVLIIETYLNRDINNFLVATKQVFGWRYIRIESFVAFGEIVYSLSGFVELIIRVIAVVIVIEVGSV